MPAGVVGSMVGAAFRGAAKFVGKATWNGLIKPAGALGLSASKVAGAGAIDITKASYRGGKSLVMKTVAQVLDRGNQVQLTESTGKIAQNIGSLMSNRTKAAVNYNMITRRKEFDPSKLELSGIAKTAIAGAFLYKGAQGMGNEIKAERMGQIDEHKRTATPIFGNSNPIGPLSGGADGSLVFALHNNR